MYDAQGRWSGGESPGYQAWLERKRLAALEDEDPVRKTRWMTKVNQAYWQGRADERDTKE